EGDKTLGEITTSHYDSKDNEIFILGQVNADTDEYDRSVIIHEFAHYFENQFSRSDSIGGEHSSGDILDIRVAWGEGFANAFYSMVTDDVLYIDTAGLSQALSFGFDLENNVCANPGWYSECSVQSIMYDLYDTNSDGADNVSLGLSSIYNTLIGSQKITPAFTSIFSFIKNFKDNNGASVNLINTLVGAQNIDVISSVYGDGQATNNPGATDQLPLYAQ
ncbi:MAG: hypothetical protein JKY93_06835, partial [Gammaproteobacteria bacterium]|nr:hypothetical protein [Gammaproteobacteria bacterium]